MTTDYLSRLEFSAANLRDELEASTPEELALVTFSGRVQPPRWLNTS